MKLRSFIILSIIFIYGCRKGSDVSHKEDRIKMLVNKKWQMTKDAYYTRGDDGNTLEVNNYGGIAHTMDDYVIYYPDFTMEWNDNQLLDPNDVNKIYTGKWNISDDGKTLSVQLLSPVSLPSYSREIISVTENEYKTTDVRGNAELRLKYFTTYAVIP